jgi:hypothetical protein
MATAPVFAVTPRVAAVSIATADSGMTAPTNYGSLITGASTGTRISEIVCKVAITSTSTVSVVRVFLYDGTNTTLFDEVALPAATAGSGAVSTRVSTTYNNLILPSAAWSLRVATSVAQATHVTALGADL